MGIDDFWYNLSCNLGVENVVGLNDNYWTTLTETVTPGDLQLNALKAFFLYLLLYSFRYRRRT